jgi:hypothetical protein
MIFNRLTDDRIIEANIHKADVPARYPFIWCAASG